MPYKDPIRQRQAQRDHYLAHREDYRRRSKEGKRRKRERMRNPPEYFTYCDGALLVPCMCPCPGCGDILETTWKAAEGHQGGHTDEESERFYRALSEWQASTGITPAHRTTA
jgi:hypothetical protein